MTTESESAPELGNSVMDVARIAVHAPKFRPEKPALWFAQLEGQFALANITRDATKYAYVTSQLDAEYAAEVEDIIVNPPPNDKYDAIKNELIKRLSVSREQKLRQLLEHEEIGDRKPSQFLRHLKSLAGFTVPDEFLKTLWMNRLPSTVQAILASQSSTTLDDSAQLADKISEIIPREIAAMTSAPSGGDSFAQRLDRIEKEVASLKKNCQGNHCSRSRPRSKSRATSDVICWFHRKFGSKATRCTQPCSFKSGNDPTD